MQLAQIKLTGSEQGLWLISAKGKLWLPQGDIPYGHAQQWQLIGLTAQQIGHWKEQTVWFVGHEMPAEMCWLKCLLGNVDDGLFKLAGRAVQLADFYASHQFCGYCNKPMSISQTEWCCLCNYCQQRYYPQIAPSIIVGIRNKNKILLAKHVRHQQNPIYTVLAGFVEVGETIEEAVQREVFEETNITIKNIRYVASQVWPFPNSIMLAYLADYESGEIMIDTEELIEADWYHYQSLPVIPPYSTIARRLIEETLVLCRQYDEGGE